MNTVILCLRNCFSHFSNIEACYLSVSGEGSQSRDTEQGFFLIEVCLLLPGSPMNKAKVANHERHLQRLQIQDNAACGETSLNRVSISKGKGGSKTTDLGMWSPHSRLPGR